MARKLLMSDRKGKKLRNFYFRFMEISNLDLLYYYYYTFTR